jgi:Ca2+-binding EF-hand superfamily protein
MLLQTFRRYDVSGDGRISRNELRAALEALGLPSGRFSTKLVMKVGDRSGDGYLDFNEFKKIVSSFKGPY